MLFDTIAHITHHASLHLCAQEVECFVEAYAAEIQALALLSEEGAGQQAAVISSRDASSLQAFCQLYNELHFPEH